MTIRLRPLTEEEQATIGKWSRSRTESARRVERATIIRLASEGQTIPQIARERDLDEQMVRKWVKQFLERGLEGLDDAPRAGAPPRYGGELTGRIIAAALTAPKDLGQDFASWTFERLATYLNEVAGIAIKHSRVHEILTQEGLRWRQQETWFSAKVDPDFAAKRGR